LNLQPAVYKLDSELPDTTHDELTQGKTDESEEPSSWWIRMGSAVPVAAW